MLFSRDVLKEAQETEDYWGSLFRKVFKSPDGKKVLLYLFQESGMFDVAAQKDAELFLAGKRALILDIFNIMGLDPMDVTIAQSEALNVIERGEVEQFGE
jgi:hypothetical protein